MNTKKLCQLLILFITISVSSQKLPEDALDTNVAFIFYPTASQDDNNKTFEGFTNNIIENGYNLVGRYIHTNTPTSLKEIEYDLKHKDVKYLFLLTYKHAKEANYDLYFYENTPDINMLDPKKTILSLKPGFIHTTKDFRGTIQKLLTKQTDKLKESNQNLNQSEYDKDLMSNLLLSEEEVIAINELNNQNTLIDGSTLNIENSGLPSDLKNSSLAVVGVKKENYRGYKLLNKILKSKIKKYPFEYTYFKDYDQYLAAGGDQKFRYKLQLMRKSVSSLGTSTPKNTTASSFRSKDNRVSYYSLPSVYQKDFFAIVLLNNNNKERNLITENDFAGKSMNEFLSQL